MLIINKKPEIINHVDRLKKTWSNYGKTEPYWSVVTDDAYTTSNMKLKSENKNTFYKSGEKQATWIMKEIKNVLPEFTPNRILDYGCGVGRITKYFPNADGCDISKPHLEIATKENKNKFILIEPGECPKYYDLIYSLIVLQHNHPDLMKQCIYSILDALTINGIAFLHIPYFMPMVINVTGFMEMHSLSKIIINDIISFQRCKLLKVVNTKMCGNKILDAIFIIQKI